MTAIVFVTVVAPSSAATYHVDASQGNDANPGTDTQPWKTLDKSQAIVVAGDTVRIRNGNYGSLAFTSTSPNGTSWATPITYVAEAGHTPTFSRLSISGGTRQWYLLFEGLTVSTGAVQDAIAISFKDASAIKVVNCSIVGNYVPYKYAGLPSYGVRLLSNTTDYYTDVTIDGCDITGFTKGIGLGGYAGTDIVFSNNTIHNMSGSGILLNASGTRENMPVVVSGNHIFDQNPCIIRIDVYGEKSGTFETNETVTQAQTGATGTVSSQSADHIRIVPRSLIPFETGAGKTITGQNTGSSLAAPSTIQVVEGEHGSGLEIRTRNLIIRNNIIHDYGNTRGIRCYPGHYDGEDGTPGGGYSNMLFENNLIYDTRNSNVVECPESGENFVFRNNSLIGQNRGRTGPYCYEAALYLSALSGVDGSTIAITNNVLVGITGLPPTNAVFEGNVTYALGGWQTGWMSQSDYPGNIIVKTDSGSSVPAYFEGSGHFFVGGELFEQYSYTYSNGSHGKNLNDAYQLAAGAGAIDAGLAEYAPTTDLPGNPRTDQPDAGCYEYLNTNPDNHAPVLRSIGSQSATVNSILTFTVTADDADNDTLTYSAMGTPSGARFSEQTFTWTPTAIQTGTYEITLKVTDGQYYDSETITITVIGPDDPASGQPVLAAIGNKSVQESEQLTFAVSASDPDGDPITYSASGLPGGASFSSQRFTWIPTYDQAGTYQVTFVASDGQTQDTETITITVTNVNRPPALSTIGDQSVDEQTQLAFTLSADDPDGDTITYSAGALPTGARLSDGRFSWTPTSDQVGAYEITFVASDGRLQDSQSITLYVFGTGPDGTAPVVTRCNPEPDAIQVVLNNLITLHVTDSGHGVDAESVIVRVDGDVVYQGDVDVYTSDTGQCTRSGTWGDYRFIYQPDELFGFDHTVTVTVSARDRAGNSLNDYAYSFTTEMRAFGGNAIVCNDAGTKGYPTTVGDSTGTIWVAWHTGIEGDRDIYVAQKDARTDAFAASMPLTTNPGDQCYPDMALGADGQLYLVWQDNSRGNWDIFVATSADGTTWSRPVQITDSDQNETSPVVAVDSQSPYRVYVAWQDDRNGNADIYVASSTNAFAESTIVALTANGADQYDPDLAVDGAGVATVVWTDMRNGQADIYGAASDGSNWVNVPIVTTTSAQICPALAADEHSSTLHLVWIDDAPGNNDIYYAISQGLPDNPLTGGTIIDDTTGADQLAPAIICHDSLHVFACWQDLRYDTDTDLFITELGSGAAKTNILIGDNRTSADQSEPALGVDGYGNPYLVWTDNRSSQTDIYCAATTFINPQPLDSKLVIASEGATIGPDPATIDEPDDVSLIVPAGACQCDVRITISQILNPQAMPAECLGSYDFGPSGIDFDEPVTVTIPYRFSGNGTSAKPYWYDSLTGALSQQGITDIENIVVASDLNALRFKTTHFTPFYLMAAEVETSDGSGGGGGGGCSVSATGNSSPKELLIPYGIIAVVMVALRRWDKKKRQCFRTTQA